MNPPTPWIDVSAGLVFRRSKLLITRRPEENHLGGLWEFPGGKREAGESLEECLQRELREELGIEVRIVRQLDTIEHRYPEKSVRLHFFQCRWICHEPQPLGCQDFSWVQLNNLSDFDFPAADDSLIQNLLSRKDWWLADEESRH